MKRRLLIVLGAGVLALVLLLALARVPALQRWVVLRAVAGTPGLVLEVDHVSAGLSGAELRGVDLTVAGSRIRLPQVEASYDGWAFLFRREVVVRELAARDVEIVVITQPAPATGIGAGSPVEAAKQAFGGLLAPLQLPYRTTVESVQLAGSVRLSETQTAKFSAQGRLLVPGQEAATDLHLEWSDTGPAAAPPALDWVGRLTTTANAAGAVERLQVSGTLAMPKSAGRSEQGVVIQLVAAGGKAGAPETIEATARLSTAKEKDAPLARLGLAYAAGAERVTGAWNVNLRREQLDGVVDLEQLPEFAVEAKGEFSAAVASGDFSANGQAAITASKLQRLRREFATIGVLSGKLGFAVERKGDLLQLARLELAVNDARGLVLKLAALQPVGYELQKAQPVFARPDQDLLSLEFGGLPLVWAQPWLEDATLGGTVNGGEIRVKGAGSAWAVATVRPIVFAGVRFGTGGKIVAEQLGGELKVQGSVDGAAWKVDSLELALRGAAEGLPATLNVQLQAQQGADGRGRAKLPLALDNGGRRSQLTLDGEWQLAEAVKKGAARVSGDTIYLRDLMALAALLPKTEAPAAAPAPTSGKGKAKTAPAVAVTKDTQAFWNGFEGRAEIDLRRVVLESEEVTNVQATLVCDAQKLTLERFAATTKSAPLAAELGVTFEAAKAAPYTLQGNCTFPGFDVGAWLRAATPGEDPAIETVLDVSAKLEGQGANLDDLLNGVRGEFLLKGGPGVLRIKDKKVEAASQLGGLVLGLLSKEKQQKASVVAGSQLLEELREFRFQQIDVSLLRAEDLNLQFRSIDVRSAEKRLTATGTAKHVAGKTIDEYPLQLEVRLAGKDNFAALLDQARLLDGTKDELGYLKLREPFTVTGTVGEPNWKKMLAQLAAGLAFGK